MRITSDFKVDTLTACPCARALYRFPGMIIYMHGIPTHERTIGNCSLLLETMRFLRLLIKDCTYIAIYMYSI